MRGVGGRHSIEELKLGGKGKDATAPVLQQIVRLERRIFPKHESLSSALGLEARKRNSFLLYAVSPTQSQVDQVAGYVIYSFTSSLAACIVKLAVGECFRQQGYGEALLRAAISRCQERSVCRVTLHVDPTREAAMNLYKKLGFELDTVVQDYYSPRRNAHRMFIEFDTP